MSATKRIRYTGHSGTGVDVRYFDPERGVQSVTVEQGHLLPTEVPASVRDNLLSQEGEWSEVASQKRRKTKTQKPAEDAGGSESGPEAGADETGGQNPDATNEEE